MTERAIVFGCEGEELLGILHSGQYEARVGVLVIVGGPQYRVGSHRQFVLLARALALGGIPVFRFDYRGMGDASGEARSFEHVRGDITTAIDTFLEESRGMEKVVLWGLCDAASAAIDYAWRDSRVAGMVLLNPWVRTEEGLAKAYLKHYYLKRMVSRDLWSGLIRGRVNPFRAIRAFVDSARLVFVENRRATPANQVECCKLTPTAERVTSEPLKPGESLPVRMAEGARRFNRPVLIVLSGDDLTADEFRDTVEASVLWRSFLERQNVEQLEVASANHTFSRNDWRGSVERATLTWVNRIMNATSPSSQAE